MDGNYLNTGPIFPTQRSRLKSGKQNVIDDFGRRKQSFCDLWATNDKAMNNHIRKHYNKGLAFCYSDGFLTGSIKNINKHMEKARDIVMKSRVAK